MHRIIRALPRRHVAARSSTGIRRNIQAVIVVDVAGSAGNAGVSVGERETERGVVKSSVRPFGNGMALCAGRGGIRKSRLDVIGNIAAKCRSLVPIGEMATDTVGRIQRVVVADVAGSAGRRRGRHVRAGQRKTCRAMIEGSAVPPLCSVAGGAIAGGECRA